MASSRRVGHSGPPKTLRRRTPRGSAGWIAGLAAELATCMAGRPCSLQLAITGDTQWIEGKPGSGKAERNCRCSARGTISAERAMYE